ncbi:MAG: hypothetical protein IPP61_19635 [Cytophagaceae bacterium]|nr:hypothetical protein [Cytophagaceae bacterium]
MNNSEIKSEQVSTREFIKSIFKFFNFLGQNWQILLIALLLGTGYDTFKNTTTSNDKEYTGQIVFHLELDGSSGQNQLTGLANTFGIGGGQSQGGDILASSNFGAIVTSVNVFQNAFMREVKMGDRKDLFINIFVDSSDIKRNEWAGNFFSGPSAYSTYKFSKKSIYDFTPYENQIIGDVYTKLNFATELVPKENSSLFVLVGKTTHERLTKLWLETLMLATEDFYKEMKTKKTRQLLEIQSSRLDSLSYLMRNNDKKIARLTFDLPNVVDPTGPMKQQQLTRDNNYLSNQYYTQLANVENLNRLLFERTPIFTILEPVRLPLTIYSKAGISTRINGLIALFSMIIVLSLRKSYLEIMRDNQIQ